MVHSREINRCALPGEKAVAGEEGGGLVTFLKRRGSSTVGGNTDTLCVAESQRMAIMELSAATLLISKDLVWVG